MKQSLKWLARKVFGEYAIYHIMTRSEDMGSLPQASLPDGFGFDVVHRVRVEQSEDASIREQAFYLGEGANGWVCTDPSGRLVGLCVYWHAERYRQRNFWPLKEHEAKLVEVITLPEMRGLGIARELIARSCRSMFEQGFHRLYARIWHSNEASLKAFSNAGWMRLGTVVELFLFGRWRWRMLFRARTERGK